MPDVDRQAGQLVAARSNSPRSGAVHASRLVLPNHDPSRGLSPWWSVGGCSGVITREVDEPVDCRTCLAWMDRRGLKVGDVVDA